jgi:16S rRNA (adenine1518-N6/adenine1519-N6)-dimethyltransferase
MDGRIRAKKHLGQHFLADKNMAKKIAECLDYSDNPLLEIGPGMGSLTGYLADKWGEKLWLVEIDNESVEYLHKAFPALISRTIEADFLTLDLNTIFKQKPFSIIGNFPYNISSQILFKAIEFRSQVIQVAGMFQKEVAKRICSPPGNKDYGILSVLVQAYFDTKYLFDVPPTVFVPPPDVNSGVIKLIRKPLLKLKCNEDLFMAVVKAGFNQRRKKLSNALSGIIGSKQVDKKYLDLRAEQLSWEAFEELTLNLEKGD